MNIELILIIAFIWFAICFTIGLLTSNKNKWGPDAVENYVNINQDRTNITIWTFAGIIGFVFIIALGSIFG